MGPCAEVAERQTRYVQGVVSARACGFKSRPRHHHPAVMHGVHALVAQWIERYPAEVEAVGSSPAKRAIFPSCGSVAQGLERPAHNR